MTVFSWTRNSNVLVISSADPDSVGSVSFDSWSGYNHVLKLLQWSFCLDKNFLIYRWKRLVLFCELIFLVCGHGGVQKVWEDKGVIAPPKHRWGGYYHPPWANGPYHKGWDTCTVDFSFINNFGKFSLKDNRGPPPIVEILLSIRIFGFKNLITFEPFIRSGWNFFPYT